MTSTVVALAALVALDRRWSGITPRPAELGLAVPLDPLAHAVKPSPARRLPPILEGEESRSLPARGLALSMTDYESKRLQLEKTLANIRGAGR